MRRFVKRVKRANGGSAAIEFAIVGPAFLLMMFSVIETGMVLFAGEILSHGISQASRQIRTGQAQAVSMTQAQFRQVVCNEVNYLLSCDVDKLHIDVRSFTSFGGSSFPPPMDANGNIDPAATSNFDPGQTGGVNPSSSIVLVRGFYEWQLFTPMFGQFLKNMPGNKRLLSASVAFKNEPF
jgi:Flp pilus assembly protein TadG